MFKKRIPAAQEAIRDHYTQEISTKLEAHTTQTIAQIHFIISHATPKDITKLHNAVQKAAKAREKHA